MFSKCRYDCLLVLKMYMMSTRNQI